FGLAKVVGTDAPVNLTMTNMVMGTPHYMAPEQVENPKAVDHRADIYAIGVVLYEMLTGELPIGRFELPSKKVQVDVRLDEVVLKALEKSPEKRFQAASDIKDAVTKATSVGSSAESYMPTVVTPKPTTRKGQPVWVWTLLAVIGPVLGYFIGTAITSSHVPTTQLTVNAPTPPVVEKPVVAAPLDLTPLYFGPGERPAGYVYQQTGTDFP